MAQSKCTHVVRAAAPRSRRYCSVATKGGYTIFSKTGLKVVPRKRQMLFFGYKYNPTEEGTRPLMDNGFTYLEKAAVNNDATIPWDTSLPR